MKNFINTVSKALDYSSAYVFYKSRLSKFLGLDKKEIDILYKELQSSDFFKEWFFFCIYSLRTTKK